MLTPALFSKKKPNQFNKAIVLAGDIGATKTHLALLNQSADDLFLIKEQTYATKSFSGPVEIVKAFLAPNDSPDKICLGVAGPVQEGIVHLTNVGWQIDQREISKQLNDIPSYLINDLEAMAYGLAALKEEDIVNLHTGKKGSRGNIGLIAPGTGLGEAGLYWDGEFFSPFATEGGHCDFAPRTSIDVELYYYLTEKLGHVSVERVISGPGIFTIFQFLRDIKKKEMPRWLAEKMAMNDPSAVISEHAITSPICAESMEMFFRYLATEAANLVLKLKATGGLFIGGGIIRKNMHIFNKTAFVKNFCNSGRMNELLNDVPVNITLNDKTALLGAAYFALYQN